MKGRRAMRNIDQVRENPYDEPNHVAQFAPVVLDVSMPFGIVDNKR
jgi:hypothetical protein